MAKRHFHRHDSFCGETRSRSRCLVLVVIGMMPLIFWIISHMHATRVMPLLQEDYPIASRNYTLNEEWRRRFLKYGFTRIHISEQCKFAYFTTLKTASTTTRLLIDKKECGLGVDLYHNGSQRHNCGDHDCTPDDLRKLESEELFKMIFFRNPISRFESAYNYLMDTQPVTFAPENEFNESTESVSGLLDTQQAFRGYIHHLYHWVKGSGFISSHHRMHLQPQMHSLCVKMGEEQKSHIKCFRPDFVAHVETLMDDTTNLMSKLPELAATWDGTLKFNKEGGSHWIEKRTIFKYPKELLMVCEIYWNDFQCGNYIDDIPQMCVDANKRLWHMPNYCIDINNNRIL